MPDGMSPENSQQSVSSIESMRRLGQVGPDRPPQTPPTVYGSAENKWQEQLNQGNISSSVEQSRRSVDLLGSRPGDPNYDPAMEAVLRGINGPERSPYVRDRLYVMYETQQLSNSMISYAESPQPGSQAFNVLANHEIQREIEYRSRRGKENLTPEDKKDIRDAKVQELLQTETNERKELEMSFKLSVAAGQKNLVETIGMLSAYVAPKPFEANMQERHFTGAKSTLESAAVYFDGVLPEKIAGWYKNYDSINEQQFAHFKILAAAGGSLEGYYDALAQAAGTLTNRARYHANMADFRAAFSNIDPGVSPVVLKDTEKVNIKDTIASKEQRERQVEMLSQARLLILVNADVSQLDMDKPVGEDSLMKVPFNEGKLQRIRNDIARLTAQGSHNETIKLEEKLAKMEGINKKGKEDLQKMNVEGHRRLMRLVFGEIDESKWVTWKSPDTGREIKTPRENLTWYSGGDKLKEREEWIAKMMATLMYKKDGKNLSEILKNADNVKILEIAKEIVEGSEYIKNNFGSKLLNANYDFMSAKIALTSWIETDKAFQTSGRLAWQFIYKEINGKLERVYDTGGLYKAFDSVNLRYYWKKWIMYKGTWKSTTQFVMAASEGFRRDVYKHGPDWLPPLDRISDDPKIKKIVDRIFSDSPEDRLWRAKRLRANDKLTENEMQGLVDDGKLFPDIDGKIIDELKGMSWSLQTPYLNSAGKEISMPMFMPKSFETNMWALMIDKSTGESAWDMMCRGVLPKDIRWENFNYETLDRGWVSMSMLARFAKFFVDSYSAEKDEQLQSFFGDAGGQSIAELSKRIYLAFRDLPEGYQQLIPAILPYAIAQHTASSLGLSGTNVGDAATKQETKKRWNFIMSKWIRAIKWMPNVIIDDEQVYNGDNASIKSMRSDTALMLMMYKECFERLTQAVYKSDVTALSSVSDDQMETYNRENDLFNPDKGEAGWAVAGETKLPWDQGEKAVQKLLFGER